MRCLAGLITTLCHHIPHYCEWKGDMQTYIETDGHTLKGKLIITRINKTQIVYKNTKFSQIRTLSGKVTR